MNLLTVELPLNVSPEEATFMMSAKLFETGKLSLGQAAKLAGYSKRTYIELISKIGVAVVNYPADDLEQEMAL